MHTNGPEPRVCIGAEVNDGDLVDFREYGSSRWRTGHFDVVVGLVCLDGYIPTRGLAEYRKVADAPRIDCPYFGE